MPDSRSMASPAAYRYVARAISPLRGTERPRGNVGWSVDGQSILYESIAQVPTDLEGGLKPVEARETWPSPAKYCLGRAARKGGLTRFVCSINSTHAESSWQCHLRA